MNDESMNTKFEQDETEAENMLEEYDFSKAKLGRHRGFQGSLIRAMEDNTEQVIELKNDSPNAKRDQQHLSLLLDTFIVEYFEAKAGEQGVQRLINQVLAEYQFAQLKLTVCPI